MGLSPLLWGRYYWSVLTLTALRYDHEAMSRDTREQLIQFFRLLPAWLPCPSCSHHIQKYMQTHPLPLGHTTDPVVTPSNTAQPYDTPMVRWTMDLHNVVNERLGKPVLTYEEAWRRFEQTFFHPTQTMGLTVHAQMREDYAQQLAFLTNLYGKHKLDMPTPDVLKTHMLDGVEMEDLQWPMVWDTWRQDVELMQSHRAYLRSQNVPVETLWDEYRHNQRLGHLYAKDQMKVIRDLEHKIGTLKRTLADQQQKVTPSWYAPVVGSLVAFVILLLCLVVWMTWKVRRQHHQLPRHTT